MAKACDVVVRVFLRGITQLYQEELTHNRNGNYVGNQRYRPPQFKLYISTRARTFRSNNTSPMARGQLPQGILLTPPMGHEFFIELILHVDHGYRVTRELAQREEPLSGFHHILVVIVVNV
jgi:hypothetical protein